MPAAGWSLRVAVPSQGRKKDNPGKLTERLYISRSLSPCPNVPGSRGDNTRCGVRRNEEFLAACYRMQWLSGTYEQSCVQPCESGEDGRVRLMAMLRRSGCIRSDG